MIISALILMLKAFSDLFLATNKTHFCERFVTL